LKIYFACSITGGRDFEPVYGEIIAALLSDGHEVPTAHLADSRVNLFEGQVPAGEVYERDTTWICECEVLVAEISTPSHGVGYEVAYALNLGKPVLCVFQVGESISKMLTGNSHELITVKSYHDSEEAIAMIRAFLQNQAQL
jgi:nucleoside 2-deoxyribosyltransferase